MRIDSTSAAPSKELQALKKACEQFEAIFAKQLLSEMRKGTEETPMGDQAGSAIYKDMMDQAIGDSIAHQGALGIGQMLYKQFAKQVAGTAEFIPPSGKAAPESSIRPTTAVMPNLPNPPTSSNQPDPSNPSDSVTRQSSIVNRQSPRSADNPNSKFQNPKSEEDK